jgi:hypothetical protein
VTGSGVDELLGGLTGVDHEAVLLKFVSQLLSLGIVVQTKLGLRIGEQP